MGAADWLLNNIGRASWGRWMPGAPAQNEGGVDVPEPPGTPIYALGTGVLEGAGNFTHANGSAGYGVVTENVPGVGQVYYQHINIAPGIPFCKNGNCGGYVVHAGQLVGYSRQPPGEVEVGINATWGGIWGTNRNNALWVSDPRAQLVALAKQSGNVAPNSNSPISGLCANLPPSLAFALCGLGPGTQNAANDAAAAAAGIFPGQCAPWDVQCVLAGVGPLLQRLLVFTLGMVLLIIGFWLLATKAGEGIAEVVINGNQGGKSSKVETVKKAAEVAAL